MRATLAQLVEHVTRNDKVRSSILRGGSQGLSKTTLMMLTYLSVTTRSAVRSCEVAQKDVCCDTLKPENATRGPFDDTAKQGTVR